MKNPGTASWISCWSRYVPTSAPPTASPVGRPIARLYALDWLRMLAMIVVFLFHVAHIFDLDPESSIKNSETSVGLSVYVFFVHQWQMHLFFLLAGSSSWFSLRTRASPLYLRERVHRLLVPLLFGSVVLIPWSAYLSALNHAAFDGSYWSFFPIHFERVWATLKTPPADHGLIALYYTSWHLWFLGYLLAFSVAALPLMRRASERGNRTLLNLSSLCEKPWGLLAFGVPIALIKVALNASFPAYLDWSDTLVWLTLFIYGWLFETDARFARAITQQAMVWLVVGCVCFALMIGAYALGHLTEWLNRPRYSSDYLLYQVLASLNTWAWLLAITGCGLRWLNFSNAGLSYGGEAVLPFYVLHEPVIFTIAFVVVQWRLGIWWKCPSIAVTAFVATMLVYELVVRRSRYLRVLFGMKAAARTA